MWVVGMWVNPKIPKHMPLTHIFSLLHLVFQRRISLERRKCLHLEVKSALNTFAPQAALC